MTSVNQQEIADRLNISRTTVSRCFTNHAGINPDTRAKVFALAAQMGYHYLEPRSKDEKGNSISSGYGVLICSDTEEYDRPDYESPGVEIMPGVSEYAQLHKIPLSVHFVSPSEGSLNDPSYRKISALRKRAWDGILLIYPFPQTVVEQLVIRFPCVSLVDQYGQSPLECVDVDHYKGIALLMDRLYALGHRRIGFFSREYEVEASWSYRRFSAYVEKITRLGLPFREEDILNVYQGRDGGIEKSHDRAAELIRDGVTAWVCAADHQAYDLIAALKLRGISVPNDVSITGFDGILRPTGAPLLTTGCIPYREIGFTGAKRLRDLISKRFTSTQHILLECRYQEGETIGPARIRSKFAHSIARK